MNLLKMTLSNRWLKVTLSVVLVQQTLVGIGTYLLGDLASSATSTGIDLKMAVFLFICIALPGSLIHYFVVYSSVKAEKGVLSTYFDAYFTVNYSHPEHWRNEDSQCQRHQMMCREGQDTLKNFVHFLVDVVSTVLNIAFNTVSIMLVTNSIVATSIFLAGGFGLFIIHLFNQKIARTSQNELTANNSLNGHLSQSWDNVVLGNKTFFSKWMERYEKLFASTEGAAIDVVKKRDFAVALAAFSTTSIVLATMFIQAWLHQGNSAFLVSLLVMIPRAFQIVLHIQVIQSYWAEWKSVKEKLSLTEESINPLTSISLDKHIRINQITLKGSDGKIHSLDDVESFIRTNSIGRYTIQGCNGVGKSTLLLKMKSLLGEECTYLPSHHQLHLNELGHHQSTGEKLQLLLNYLVNHTEGSLLLDEWDANLSKINRDKLNHMIDSISTKRLIIEVRHREDEDITSVS